MLIFKLDAVSDMCQTSAKSLATSETEKKDKYFHPCLNSRRFLTPMVYSADKISATEAVALKQRLASLLSNNLKREYLDMCGFVRDIMSLAIVRSNTLILRGTRDKEAHIRQMPDFIDGSVMALIDS